MVLSALGSPADKVNSLASLDDPSKTKLPVIVPPKAIVSLVASPSVIVPPLKVVVPVTVRFPPTEAFPVTVKLSAMVVSDVVCPMVTAIPDVSVAIFKVPVELLINEFEQS